MDGFREWLLRWYLPPAPLLLFGSGQTARGLTQLRGVGCPLRGTGACPYPNMLFACAECSRENPAALLQPPSVPAAA